MPTIENVIAIVDEIKPNSYSEQIKTKWINEVEGRIKDKILRVPHIPYKWPEDSNTVLVVPGTYSDIYESYLFAMIEWFNRDFEAYNNEMLMYNSKLTEIEQYYKRIQGNETTGAKIKNFW